MSSLRDIRRRLRSTENIKKITDAMERVASARLRRAQTYAEQSRPYAKRMQEILTRLTTCPDIIHPLFIQREVRKSAVIIVSADKGLSGSYNANVLSAANKFLKNYTPENMHLLLFGKKAIEHYQNSKWIIDEKYSGWTGKITLDEIAAFTNQVVDQYMIENYDEIWLVYTHFISIAHREVVVNKFLNISKPKAESDKAPKHINYIFEPSPTEILAEILLRYCTSRIQEVLHEAYAAELSARIMAMQMASKNSETMIETLTLVRNRVRQESITREMIEIAPGVG
jgi:F-type H+-transporting ATPase subunit gamma